jgi:hypothetical protein
MRPSIRLHLSPLWLAAAAVATCAAHGAAQLTDVTQTPNALHAGIQKSLEEEIGAGRGDLLTPDSSAFMIARDPFRAIARGRQLFQRKFTDAQGLGPRRKDGIGDIAADGAIGAGLSDSCAACHGRPFGSAGAGGNVFTRPESRDAPHLFGLGLIEMLADEITSDLRYLAEVAKEKAFALNRDARMQLISKGIDFGTLTAHPDGTLDTTRVVGVDDDLRVKPFFHDGRTFAIREFVVGAFNAEMGLESSDTDLLTASTGQDVVTPAGMRLPGSLDVIGPPPALGRSDDPDGDGVIDEVPTSLVDDLEFYLLNYHAPGLDLQTDVTKAGVQTLNAIGCTDCHVRNLVIEQDRRVAAVGTAYDPVNSNGVFSHLYATAVPIHGYVPDGSGYPPLMPPLQNSFTVKNVFTDFRRHDLGPNFHERNFDGSMQTLFMTEPLWGVGDTAPYGHDGRSCNLDDVILRHGGEAQRSRDDYAALPKAEQDALLAFLRTLVLFSPPYTASNLAPAHPDDPDFPVVGAGSIDLSPLFVDPADKE